MTDWKRAAIIANLSALVLCLCFFVMKTHKTPSAYKRVLLEWINAGDGRTYNIYRSSNRNADDDYEWIGNSTVPRFVDDKAQSGHLYYYRVESNVDGFESPPSDAIKVVVP